MVTQQLLIRLPEDLLRRFRRKVSVRQRSAFVQSLLEQALPPDDDDKLHLIALAVEQDEVLAAEMAEWDQTVADGIPLDGTRASHR